MILSVNKYMKCQINTHEIRLTLDWSGSNKINAVRCCYKDLEIIKSYTLDEIINDNNFFKNLKKYAAEIKQHDWAIYSYCNTTEKICNWFNDEIDTVSVSTSTACNLNCIMCNYKKYKYNKLTDKNIYFTILNKLKNNHLKTIGLTMEGEPFFYKNDSFKYIKSLTRNDCEYLYIISNLTLLNESDIILLNNIKNTNKINILFEVSIDGITEETYKKIRNNNKFNQIINNTILLNKFNMLNKINFVAQPENLHELSFLKEYWAEKNIYNINVMLLNGVEQEKIKFVLSSNEWKTYKNNLQ